MQFILKEINDSYSLHKIIGNIPILNFYSDEAQCTGCGKQLVIEKVKSRIVYTVAYGELKVRESIKKCPVCQQKYRSPFLPQIVKSGSNYSYDCMVEIGKLRYTEKRQIVEIQSVFRNKYQLLISCTQIRRMAYNFLFYLGKLHYSSLEKINTQITKQGGYIVYVDSTCDGHAPHLLTCLDGISGYVLYSQKIQSESTLELKTAFEKVKTMFGRPLCCVHDMGRGINSALAIVFVGVMQVICHFHLLRDIGKDLLEALYRKVQKTLSNHEIYAKIRYQTKALEKTVGGKEQAVKLFCGLSSPGKLTGQELLTGAIYGYLLDLKSHEKNGNGYGFPFDRPKVQYYKLLSKIHDELVQIDALPNITTEMKNKSRFYKVKEVLDKIVENNDLKLTINQLDEQVVHFDKLREIMRIAQSQGKNGLNDEGVIESEKELKSMEKELGEYVKVLNINIKKEPRKNEKLQGVITQLEKYWDKIFARPIKITVEGKEKILIPHRTNNRSEQFYRKIKHLFRRLHGRPNVGKDIDFIPEEIALIENLKNQDYVKTVLNSSGDLASEFAKLDIQKIELPFEKKDIDLKVSQKLIRKLKNFNPLCIIKKCA